MAPRILSCVTASSVLSPPPQARHRSTGRLRWTGGSPHHLRMASISLTSSIPRLHRGAHSLTLLTRSLPSRLIHEQTREASPRIPPAVGPLPVLHRKWTVLLRPPATIRLTVSARLLRLMTPHGCLPQALRTRRLDRRRLPHAAGTSTETELDGERRHHFQSILTNSRPSEIALPFLVASSSTFRPTQIGVRQGYFIAPHHAPPGLGRLQSLHLRLRLRLTQAAPAQPLPPVGLLAPCLSKPLLLMTTSCHPPSSRRAVTRRFGTLLTKPRSMRRHNPPPLATCPPPSSPRRAVTRRPGNSVKKPPQCQERER